VPHAFSRRNPLALSAVTVSRSFPKIGFSARYLSLVCFNPTPELPHLHKLRIAERGEKLLAHECDVCA
jgi:hypothetical protein